MEMYCEICGERLEYGARICPYCGNSTEHYDDYDDYYDQPLRDYAQRTAQQQPHHASEPVENEFTAQYADADYDDYSRPQPQPPVRDYTQRARQAHQQRTSSQQRTSPQQQSRANNNNEQAGNGTSKMSRNLFIVLGVLGIVCAVLFGIVFGRLMAG